MYLESKSIKYFLLCCNMNSSKLIAKQVKHFYKSISYKLHSTSYSTSMISDLRSEVTETKFKEFDKLVLERREQAKNSILVQIKNDESCKDLYTHCNSFGPVKSMYYYRLSNNHYALVEFEGSNTITNVLSKCRHLDTNQVIPIKSPMLWFRSDVKPMHKSVNIPSIPHHSISLISKEELHEELKNAKSLSDQMLILYSKTRLTDLGTRLRFLAAQQIEIALSGLFPSNIASPFGSSVNSFGKINCDLDLVIQLDPYDETQTKDNRLIFQSKPSIGINRNQIQRHMETVGDIIQYFLPGCNNVKRILQARVPIIRYKQDLTGIECDVSMTNMTGVYMSELLYIYGSSDWRVCPLVFAIRYWAREINLTNAAPGRWISNFSLTLLVLFYLQQVGIIVPLDTLVIHKRKTDKRVADGEIDCSFLRDISKLPHTVKNNDTLFTLLFGFFEYYSSFDLHEKALSLNSGKAITKPEYSALYIVNPLERYLNVSKNVSLEECEKLQIEIRNALWILESSLHTPPNQRDGSWGLLSLINRTSITRSPFSSRSSSGGHQRLMSVKELFKSEEEIANDIGVK